MRCSRNRSSHRTETRPRPLQGPPELTFTYEGDTKTHTFDGFWQLKEEEWFSRGVAMSRTCNEDIVTASLDRLEQLRQTGTRHQIVAVATQIDHARAIRSLYAERGYEAETIHSKMAPEDRAEVIRKLKAGPIHVIVQLQMLGEGFDHPQLSVAAIFRPFRILAPYLQFVGRAVRVVVQNDPRHPDNYGYIVTHAGMNLDTLLTDFREIAPEDQQFLAGLINGDEPEPPREVTEGRAQMKIRPDMRVGSQPRRPSTCASIRRTGCGASTSRRGGAPARRASATTSTVRGSCRTVRGV